MISNRSAQDEKVAGFTGILSMLFFALWTVSLTSCGGNSNVANILPPDIQYSADTMFARNRRIKKKELDSLCILTRDSLIKVKVDSLVILEQKSIKNITDSD